MSNLSPSEIAFLMLAMMQGIGAVLWTLAAWWLRQTRAAAAHWAGYALCSALTFVFLSRHLQALPVAGVLLDIGAVTRKGPHETPSHLLMRADQALYHTKRSGRNRVQAAEDHDAVAAANAAVPA